MSIPKTKKNIWSPEFAYAIGLLATDGSLSKDGRHIDFTSADREQVENLLRCLGRINKIGVKRSGTGKVCFRAQIGDVHLHAFLSGIGITPNKTKTIGELAIPRRYFFDFLRGHFDGDGTFYSYYDRRWKSSFMFYTAFVSASKSHILWLRAENQKLLGVQGHITKGADSSVYQLKYAKAESLRLLPKMYYDNEVVCLRRKRTKVFHVLEGVKKKYARVAKLANALP